MKKNSKPLNGGMGLFVGAISLLSSASIIRAQTASELNTAGSFSTVGQATASLVLATADNACVPTADANGMQYLQSYVLATAGYNPFTLAPGTSAQAGALVTAMGTGANGTTVNGEFNGLQNYISPTGANPAPNVRVTGEYAAITPAGWVAPPVLTAPNVSVATPTAAYLAGVLKANDGVEIGLQWGGISGGSFSTVGYNGGHQVTVQAIDFNGTSGTITFLDPWGTGTGTSPSHASGGAIQEVANLSLDNGYLIVTYPNGTSYVGPEPDATATTAFAGGGQVGRILEVTVESVVPEPSTYLAGVSMLALLTTGAFRQLRGSRKAE